MTFTEEDKILINDLFDLKGYNGKHLAREFSSKSWNVGFAYQLLRKLLVTGIVDSCSSSNRRCNTTHVITLILLTNWCYTKMARREIIFAHGT